MAKKVKGVGGGVQHQVLLGDDGMHHQQLVVVLAEEIHKVILNMKVALVLKGVRSYDAVMSINAIIF